MGNTRYYNIPHIMQFHSSTLNFEACCPNTFNIHTKLFPIMTFLKFLILFNASKCSILLQTCLHASGSIIYLVLILKLFFFSSTLTLLIMFILGFIRNMHLVYQVNFLFFILNYSGFLFFMLAKSFLNFLH